MARVRDPVAFAKRQAEILEIAAGLFVRDGFHQTGMAAICKAVGMSPGTLYRYFPSKDALIRALIEAEREANGWALEQWAGEGEVRPVLIDVLVASIREYADPGTGRLGLEIAAEGCRNPEIAELLVEAEREAVDGVAALLTLAQTRGELRDGVDIPAMARLLVALVDGATGAGFVSPELPGASLRPTLERLMDGFFR